MPRFAAAASRSTLPSMRGVAGRVSEVSTGQRSQRKSRSGCAAISARAGVPADQIDAVDLCTLLEDVAVELSPLLAARH